MQLSSSEAFNQNQRPLLEIELKIANTLVVNNRYISKYWAKIVMLQMPNLRVVEIGDVKLRSEAVDLLCFCLCNYTDVGVIMVHREHIKKWASLLEKYGGEKSIQVFPVDVVEDLAPAEEESRECRESRERTPSPVRDIIDEEMAKLLQKKDRLCRVYRSEFQVPEALGSTFGIGGRYHPYPLSRPFVSTNINDDIYELANSLIHGIITTAEGNWLLVTQIEVYVKNKDIDDVAYVSRYDENHAKLTIKFEKATEGKSTWCELHIFAQQYEVLVTGGIYSNGQSVGAFLGVSAPPHMLSDTCYVLFSPASSARTVACPRTVRNFRRAASLFPWCIQSARFNDKGLSAIVALEHYQSLPPSYQSICAELISIASKSHTPEAIANLKNSLDSIEFWKDLDLPPHPTNRMVLNRLSEIESRVIKKPSKGKRWLIEAIFNHAQGISETTSTQLYNNLLYPSLRLGLIHQT